MSMAVENNVTKRSAKRNAAQLSLWDEPTEERGLPAHGIRLEDFPITVTLPFRWANGDTSPEAAQQMLAQIQGRTRELYGGEFINHHLVSYYVNVLECWIEDGVAWGKCLFWPEGAYIDALRAGTVAELDEEEDVA